MAGPYGIGSSCWPGTSRVIEEMGELGQVLGKLIGAGGATEHWDGTDLRERLVDEIADVTGALAFFAAANDLPLDAIEQRAAEKRATYVAWHRQQGAGPAGRPPAL